MAQEFHQAAENWQLEKLYLDLAKAKGRGLTPLEKQFLNGLLCGYSPSEITAKVYQGRTSSAVRVYLSNGLYKYLQDLLFTPKGSGETIKNWSRVTQLLEKAGYRKNSLGREGGKEVTSGQDWEEELDLSLFLGRQGELEHLKKYITSEGVSLLCLSGIQGTGKSLLATKLAREIAEQFDWVIWRSLSGGLTCEQMLRSIIPVLMPQIDSTLHPLALFLKCLRLRRCLVILDRWETVFLSGQLAGTYAPDKGDYRELLQRLSQEEQQSCCLVISREVPPEIGLAERAKVKNFTLSGLSPETALDLLRRSPLLVTEAEAQPLCKFSANNPLILRKFSLVIQEQFHGRITDFFAHPGLGFALIDELWRQQLDNLAPTEKLVLFTLGINQRRLGREIALPLSPTEQLPALASLELRGFISYQDGGVVLTPLLELYSLGCFHAEASTALEGSPLQGIIMALLTQTLGPS